jgi:hypothetical protein
MQGAAGGAAFIARKGLSGCSGRIRGAQDLDPMKKADYERKKQVYETESELLIDGLAGFFSGRGPAAAPPPR